jgi:hypothetical protein
MHPREGCDSHALHTATCPSTSRDGTRVYVVCGCGARRAVPATVWQAELDRRTARQLRHREATDLPRELGLWNRRAPGRAVEEIRLPEEEHDLG